MDYNFDEQTEEVLLTAKRYAEMDQDTFIRPSHILYSVLRYDNIITFTLESINVDIDTLTEGVLKIRNKNIIPITSGKQLSYSTECYNIFNHSLTIDTLIDLPTLILAILDVVTELTGLLNDHVIDYDVFEENLIDIEDIFYASSPDDIQYVDYATFAYDYYENDDFESVAPSQYSSQYKYNSTVLDSYGTNLNTLALEKRLDPCIGRDNEINNIIRVLNRKKKRNVILAGLAGVGKTQIVEGLAQKIVEGNVPQKIKNKIIYRLELANLIAGTKYRGQLEERIKSLIAEIEKSKDHIVLFIDEIHTMVNAGNAEGGLDFSNIVKPYLSSGIIQMIGATTFDELKYITADKALARRFEIFKIGELSKESVFEILQFLKPKYEKDFNIILDENLLRKIIVYCDKYIQGVFPDKALELLDDLTSKIDLERVDNREKTVNKSLELLKDLDAKKITLIKSKQYEDIEHIKNLEKEIISKLKESENGVVNGDISNSQDTISVKVEDIQSLIVEKTGISSLYDDDDNILLKTDKINNVIFGQNEAINKIQDALLLNYFDREEDSTLPIATFLFVGQTGVGKTELAKQIALNVFGSKNKMVRIDCSEYSDKMSASKLIGAASGYIGYNDGGILTNAIKANPHCVLLFDEFEKGHELLQDILLQITSEGVLTDNKGDRVDFKHVLIILSSNIGTKNASIPKIGFTPERNDFKTIILKEVEKKLKREFYNRLTDVIVFNNLSFDDLLQIVKIKIDNFSKKLLIRGITLKYESELLRDIANKCLTLNLGARPVDRLFNEVRVPILKHIIKNGMKNCELKLEDIVGVNFV